MTERLGRDQGERAAHLYVTYRPGVFATCLDVLGNAEDAADATQEIFARALPVLDGVQHPNAWLQTAARHHCLDVVRRRRVAERAGVPRWAGDRQEADPGEVVVQRQHAATTMAALPERERRALAHVAIRDATVGEIAVALQLSYAAALQLLSRARRRAVQVAQLPAGVAVPQLQSMGRLLRRLSTSWTTAAETWPRGAAAGSAMVLCAAIVCGGRPPAPVATGHAETPRSNAAAAAAPGPSSVVPVPHLALPALPALAGVQRRLTRPPQPARGARACTPIAGPVVAWSATPKGSQPAALIQLPGPPVTPQTTMVRATVSAVGSGPAAVLAFRLHVQDMSLSMPQGVTAMQWSLEWNGNAIVAEVDSAGTLTYQDGFNPPHADSGRLVFGPDGFVEIDAPLANLGMAPGSSLQGLVAYAFDDYYGEWWTAGPDNGGGTSYGFTVPSAC